MSLELDNERALDGNNIEDSAGELGDPRRRRQGLESGNLDDGHGSASSRR